MSIDLSAEISIQRVQISPFSGVLLNGFLVRDQQRDTLFFADKVRIGVESFSFKHKHLYLTRVRFDSPKVNLYQHEGKMNYTFILDSLGKSLVDTVKWKYSFKGLKVEGGEVAFTHSILKNPGSIKEKLDFYDLEFDVSRISGVNEELEFKVNSFSVKEDIGLFVKDLSANCRYTDDRIWIDDLIFRTNDSYFNLKQLEIPVTERDDLGYQFRCEFYELAIASNDVRKIFNDFPQLEYPVRFSGELYGSIDNLKGRKITCLFGEQSRMVTSFDISGLSNFNETFIFLDIEDLQTNVNDFESLITGGAVNQKSIFPPSFQTLGNIRYKGNFSGFINDLVAYGTFRTNIGVINTDLGIKIKPVEGLIYGGFLSTSGFNLGKLLNLESNMGSIALDMEVSGNRKSATDYFTFIDGNVVSLNLNDYEYRNIDLKGLLTHQKFDGSVKINDPNGKLDFDGTVDMSGRVPHFNFSALLANVQLDRLKLLPKLKDGVLSMLIETDFEGDNLDDLVGEIKFSDGLLFTPKASIELDSLSIRAQRDGNDKHLVFKSNFAEGDLRGNYYFADFNNTIKEFMGHFLPSINPENKKVTSIGQNDFKFELQFKEMGKVLSVFFPGMEMSDKGYVKGAFNSEQAYLDLESEIEYFSYKNISATDPVVKITNLNSGELSITMRADEATYGKFLNLPNFSIHQKVGNDELQTNIFWNNWDEKTYSGALFSTTSLSTSSLGDLETRVHLLPSSVIVSDMIWNLSDSKASFFADGLSIEGFKIEHKDQYATLNGLLHRTSEDGLQMVFHELDLARFLTGTSNMTFSGTINGNLLLRDYFRDPLISSNIEIDEFAFNKAPLGTFRVNSLWNQELEALTVTTLLSNNEKDQIRGFGFFHPKDQHLDFQFNIDSVSVAFLDPFLNKVIQNLNGTASGKMYLKGPLTKPLLTGRAKLNEGQFSVNMLQTSYNLADSVIFYPNEMRFKDMTVTDRDGRNGKFRGSIYHNGFRQMVYNLRVDANNMLMLNTRLKDNPLYYGTVYGTGFMQLTGNTSNINIAINGRTRPNTQFFIPMQSSEVASENNFIRFSNKGVSQSATGAKQEYTVDLSGVKMDMDIEVTPDAKVQIIFDARLGDILESIGAGNIQIRMDRQGNVKFFGDYTIEEGEYLFSLQNLINKRFTINQGGTVKWQGNPYDAIIDITAVYKARASLADLLGPMAGSGVSGSSDLQRRVPIHCNLYLSELLQQPVIKFGIEAPTLDDSREALILDYISSEEELNRQVLSLLLLNKFYTPEYMRASDNSAGRNDNTALATSTEMLSSQISRWISTMSNDFDFGVAYRPGDNITSEEFEVALSTQVFNNRVTINGNVGYGKYQTNTSKMVGDFDLDIKLNNTGTIRARAYTRSNDDLIYETSPTTQGIGLSFKEEFNSFKNLLSKYKNAVLGKREDDEQ